MTWVSLSCFSVLEFSLGGVHNSRTRAESLRVCVVYRFISACPACGKRSGGKEEVPWGRSYSSSYTKKNVADVGSARPWHLNCTCIHSHILHQFQCQVQMSSSVSKFGFEDLDNWCCQQRAPHGKQQQKKKLCAQHLYISVSICVTGWKWSSVHACEYVGHWTPTPCGLGEVKGWLGL